MLDPHIILKARAGANIPPISPDEPVPAAMLDRIVASGMSSVNMSADMMSSLVQALGMLNATGVLSRVSELASRTSKSGPRFHPVTIEKNRETVLLDEATLERLFGNSSKQVRTSLILFNIIAGNELFHNAVMKKYFISQERWIPLSENASFMSDVLAEIYKGEEPKSLEHLSNALKKLDQLKGLPLNLFKRGKK